MITYKTLPIILQIGNFKIYSWGLMASIGFLISFFLILKEAEKKGIEKKHVYNLGLLCLIGIILGSRLFYILEHFRYFLKNPNEIFMLSHGGSVSYGALFLSLIFLTIYIKKNKIDFWKFFDISAPYLALGFAITRIGCFLNGCCYGKPTEFFTHFGINFIFPLSQTNFPRHPTQLYLSFCNFLIFIILLKVRKAKERVDKKKFFGIKGFVFILFLLLYSAERFFIDFLRAYKSEEYFLRLSFSQIFAIFLFILGITFLITRIKKEKLKNPKVLM